MQYNVPFSLQIIFIVLSKAFKHSFKHSLLLPRRGGKGVFKDLENGDYSLLSEFDRPGQSALSHPEAVDSYDRRIA